MLLVGVVSMAWAATGRSSGCPRCVLLVLLTDGFMALVLFRLRRRHAEAPVPEQLYPLLPARFLALYTVLFGWPRALSRAGPR